MDVMNGGNFNRVRHKFIRQGYRRQKWPDDEVAGNDVDLRQGHR